MSRFDLIIRQGELIDPKTNVQAVVDIGVLAGKVAAVSAWLDPHSAQNVFDAQGLIVVPGLIDIHTHVYQHATPLGINPDTYCLGRGVTTVVDAGSAGASTFAGLRHFISERCATRVLAFLNISLHGLASAGCSGYGVGGELDSLNQINEIKTREVIDRNRDVIVGVKVRLSSDCANDGKNELEAFHRARKASKDLPLMTHHTFSSLPLDGSNGCPGGLKKGDIYTHMFHGFPSSIVEKQGSSHRLAPSVLLAKERGVVFDVGHGAGSFSWTVAELCAKHGFWPDCISTDLHTESCGAPCYDLLTTMSKMIHLGMPLKEVIRSVTSTPAKTIGWEQKIGCLYVGGVADVTILRLDENPVWLEDSQGQMRFVKKILKPVAVWKDGKNFPITPLKVFPDTSFQSRVPIARWEQLIVRDPHRTIPNTFTSTQSPDSFSALSRFSSRHSSLNTSYNANSHEGRFSALNLLLPPPPKPFGVYRPTLEQAEQNGVSTLYISGHGPLLSDGTFMKGKVNQASKAYAKEASKQTCLAVLSTLRSKLGSLNRVKRIVKVLAMVNAEPEFEDHIEVANGFSDLLRAVFGEDGVGVRSAIGVGSLPMGIPVEMELMLEISPEVSDWLSVPSLQPVINLCGHFTSLGGSRLHPSALAAMSAISQYFVDLNSLLLHAGQRIAVLCGVPEDYGAHVTCGAAAGLALAVAACLSRDSEAATLPDISRVQKTQVVVDGGSDLRWNQSFQLTGAQVAIIGQPKQPMTPSQLQQTLQSGKTAAVIYFLGGGSEMSLKSVVHIAHERRVPVIVDAAAQLPPVSNLSHFVNLGADCVIFSGGKAIRGPQDSGFMLGRLWLVNLARSLACPNESSVARPMKTSKEAIVGLVAALEAFVSSSSQTYPKDIDHIANLLASQIKLLSQQQDLSAHVTVRLMTGVAAGVTDVQPSAHLLVFVDIHDLVSPKVLGHHDSSYGDGVNHGSPLTITPHNVPTWIARCLSSSSTKLACSRIAVNTTGVGLMLNPIVLTEAEVDYVAQRIVAEVQSLRSLQRTNSHL